MSARAGSVGMRRRDFITLLGSAGVLSLAATRPGMTQPTARVYRVGVMIPFPAIVLAGMFAELGRLGFVEGQNLEVDGRGFEGSYENFPRIAAELVTAKIDAILCSGDAAIRAAQAATTTIPIVASTDDMLGAGLLQSIARPGGNTTGISFLAT